MEALTAFLTKEALHQKSSQELTALLYEACINNLEEAITLINNKDFLTANEKMQKAGDIIHRLGAGINYEAGIIADQLEQVYNYIADKIIEANFKKDPSILQEVMNLLLTIMSSWNEAMKTKKDMQASTVKLKTRAYDTNSIYEKE